MNPSLLLVSLLMGGGPAVRFDPPAVKFDPPSVPAVTIAKPKCVCGPSCPNGGCAACECPKSLPEWRWEALPGVGMGRVHKSVPPQGPWTAEEPARPKAQPGTDSPSTVPTGVPSANAPRMSSSGFYRTAGTFTGVPPVTSGSIDPWCVGNT